jgi:transposase
MREEQRREARRRLVYEVVLRHGRGESIRGLCRALHVSRGAVRTILREEQQRRDEGESAVARELPATRTPRGSKLDQYAAQIDTWLDEFPDLTAVRLQEKLAELGFEGGYSIVRVYLRAVQHRRGQAKPKAAVQIVETLPGQQCQFDWSPYEPKGIEPVELWGCKLSWSRAGSLIASQSKTQPVILAFLQANFEEWQGVPEQAVTDTMPGVVDRWECNRPILNVRFVDFATYYHFALDVSPRRYPQYKGKVERPFRYAEDNLLNGRTFHSLEHFVETLHWWIRERALLRPHPRTKRPIRDMLVEERPYLQPLPAHPYDARDVVVRQVEETGCVRHQTNLYRVPDEQIGELVYLCIGLDRLEIVDRGVHRLAEYERAPDGAGRILGNTDPRRRRYDVTLLTARLAAWGQVAEDFAARLRTRKRYAGPELCHILGLQQTWSADNILLALQHALDYEAYDAKAVERILVARFAPRTLPEQVADATRARIRETMKDHPVASRSISSYAAFRHGDTALAQGLPPTVPQDDPNHEEQGHREELPPGPPGPTTELAP